MTVGRRAAEVRVSDFRQRTERWKQAGHLGGVGGQKELLLARLEEGVNGADWRLPRGTPFVAQCVGHGLEPLE